MPFKSLGNKRHGPDLRKFVIPHAELITDNTNVVMNGIERSFPLIKTGSCNQRQSKM